MSEVQIRPLRPDEMSRFVELSHYAFHGRTPTERANDFRRRVRPDRNCLVATEAGVIVSQVMIYELATWIGGTLYPTGGLANVATVPEKTRRGHASAMLRSTLAWMRDELGQSLSILYPTMFPLYRALGWALADDSVTIAGEPFAFQPAGDLPRDPGGEIDRHAAEPDDVDRLVPMYRSFVRDRSGYLERPRWFWEEMVLRVGREDPRWVARWRDSSGEAGGYIVYSFTEVPEVRFSAYEVVALRPEAYHGLLTFLSAHHLWNRVVISAGRDVPWRSLVANPQYLDVDLRDRRNFMLRVVDLPRALALRPVGTGASPFILEVRDVAAPWNDGVWRLYPGSGGWLAERGDDKPDASTNIAGFSSLFAGFLSVPQAIEAGVLRADRTKLEALNALFATRYPPTCRDHF